jgi:hypothetical protein
VDEREWRACTHPQHMLNFLRGKVSDRKMRLFACACCRHIWRLISDERSRQAVEVSERFADGLVSAEELVPVAHAAAAAVYNRASGAHGPAYAVCDPTTIRGFDAVSYAIEAARAAVDAAMGEEPWRSDAIFNVESRYQALLLRRDFYNPFNPLPPLAPSILQWNGGTVKRLAEQAYQERLLPSGQLDPQRLAVLADALEESGCSNQDILLHLRKKGAVHVRGCFALDWILGKS